MSRCLKIIVFSLVWAQLVHSEWDFNVNTTVADRHYDDWNDLAVSYYDWGTDEPYTIPDYVNQEDVLNGTDGRFTFMYNGGHLTWRDPKTGEMLEDWQKAQTWAMGIYGVDIYGRIYPDADCMGTLVHPRIIMTLCACVNSYYRTYYDVRPEDLLTTVFQISETSDLQFDIRAPVLMATRTSWAGFQNLTGDQEKFPLSKQILSSPGCKKAILDENPFVIMGQYKTVVFLKVEVSVNHPYSPELPSYYNFTVDSLLGKDPAQKYHLMAYFQEGFSLNPRQPNSITVVKVDGTGEGMDFGYQLMSTQWEGKSARPSRLDPKIAHQFLGICNFKAYDKYLDAVLNPGNEYWIQNLEDVMTAGVVKSVACMSYVYGLLCNAPPGSPIVLNDTLYGMSLTRVTNCSRIGVEPKWTPTIFAVVFTKDNNGLGVPEEIRVLADYLDGEEEAEKQAIEKDNEFRDGPNKGNVDIVGNIDSELISPMAQFLRENKYLPANQKSDCTTKKPYFSVLILTIMEFNL